MGKGRKPKPRALRLLNGNAGKRPLPPDIQPPRTDDVPEPPRGMPAQARKEWRRIAPLLYEIGLLTKIDLVALEAYCRVYARWLEAEKNIKKYGMVIKSEKGPVLSPYLRIADTCLDQLRKSSEVHVMISRTFSSPCILK